MRQHRASCPRCIRPAIPGRDQSGGGRRWRRLGQAWRRSRVSRPNAADQPCRPGHDGNSEDWPQGWVPIRHSGGEAVRDVQREVPGLEDDAAREPPRGPPTPVPTPTRSRPSTSSRRRLARVAKRPSPTQHALARGRHVARASSRRCCTGGGSREFLGHFPAVLRSGRYYRALWKANEDKVPEITKLHQGTVIRIPPPEELDPAYIDPPGKHRARAGRTARSSPGTTARRRLRLHALRSGHHKPPRWQRRGDGVPIRHSSRSDVELNLPVSDAATEQASPQPIFTREQPVRSGR